MFMSKHLFCKKRKFNIKKSKKMKKLTSLKFLVLLMSFMSIISCSNDDDDDIGNSVTIELELSNTPTGGQHPAHIHFNTAAEGGGIALTLGVVDGTTGKSSITVSALDDGTAIN